MTQELNVSRTASQTSAWVDYAYPKRRVAWWTVLRHATLIFFMLIVLLPLAWVLLLSAKSLPDAYQRYIWPHLFVHPLWTNYQYAWQKIPTLGQNFTNSVLVTFGTIVCATVASVLGGYALVHLKTPAKGVVIALLVASLFFPTRVTALIGIYDVQNQLGLINKTWGLIFPYTALSVAVSTFIMRGVFQTVPKEIVESAKIDG